MIRTCWMPRSLSKFLAKPLRGLLADGPHSALPPISSGRDIRGKRSGEDAAIWRWQTMLSPRNRNRRIGGIWKPLRGGGYHVRGTRCFQFPRFKSSLRLPETTDSDRGPLGAGRKASGFYMHYGGAKLYWSRGYT